MSEVKQENLAIDLARALGLREKFYSKAIGLDLDKVTSVHHHVQTPAYTASLVTNHRDERKAGNIATNINLEDGTTLTSDFVAEKVLSNLARLRGQNGCSRKRIPVVQDVDNGNSIKHYLCDI